MLFFRATSWANNPKAADIVMFVSRYSNNVLNAVWEHNLPQVLFKEKKKKKK